MQRLNLSPGWARRSDPGKGTLAFFIILLAGLGGCGGGNEIDTPMTLPMPTITTITLPDGTIGVPYSAAVQVFSGTPPLTWSVSAGSLPSGITLDSATGDLTGTPTTPGTSSFTITVIDSLSQTDMGDYTVTIGDATALVELVTVATDGVTPANGDSGSPAISSDGLLVVFTSFSTNLVSSDTNNVTDIFVRDRSCGATARVSVASDGTQANSNSFGPAISPDGSFVAYASDSNNLIPSDTNNARDIFVTALDTSSCPPVPLATIRASVANDGTEGDAASNLPSITTTAGGALVAYQSNANNLVDPDDNLSFDIFVTEVQFSGGAFGSLRTRRISTFLRLADQTADIFGPDTIGNSTQMLADDELLDFLVEIVGGGGRDQVRVISGNDATTLTVIPDWDTVPDATSVFRVLQASTASSFRARISADGAFVLFNSFNAFESEDTNGTRDVFVKELATGVTTRVSIDAAGMLADGASSASHLSGNGDTVLLHSTATNLVSNDTNALADLFVHERLTPDTLRVSLANDGSEAITCTNINLVLQPCADVNATLSGGGRLVAFSGFATTLVPDDRNFQRDIFLRDRQAGTTRRLSLGLGGINPDGESVDPAISLDGTVVVFSSFATNLVPNDTNDARDIFLVTTGITDPPLIVVSRLPAAREGVPYQASLRAVGGTPPLFWIVEEGVLPSGLFLDPGTGALSGIPQEPGRFRFTVLVMDGDRPMRRGRKTLTLEVGR